MRLRSNKHWTIFAFGILSITGFAQRNPTGQFGYNWDDGRHSHFSVIQFGLNAFKTKSWSSNFFRPTEIKVFGLVSHDNDSIVLIPRKVFFYRTIIHENGSTHFKKTKCNCDPEGLDTLDGDSEWYIVESCQPTKYYFSTDTLRQANNGLIYTKGKHD